MQTVSNFNRNLVIFLVALALVNVAVGFYKVLIKVNSQAQLKLIIKLKR